jgi:hypothetical protein
MPGKRKKPVTRELRMVVNTQEEEKIGHKGIENGCQCPGRRKNRTQGHRESSSMPLSRKKLVLRESRELVDAREEEKIGLRGIENDCQCPGMRTKRTQGH